MEVLRGIICFLLRFRLRGVGNQSSHNFIELKTNCEIILLVMKLYSTVPVALLLGGFLPSSFGDDPVNKEHPKLLRDQDAQRNLRASSGAEGNPLLSDNPDVKIDAKLEEDEQLWERILQQDFSIPPTPRPTFPPVLPQQETPAPTPRPTRRPTPEPTSLPEQCDLSVSYLLLCHLVTNPS